MKKIIIVIFSVFIFGTELSAQKYTSGPQVLSFHSLIDGTDQPYALYIPKNFKTKKAYPLVVMLHGAGSNHRLALRRVFGKSNLPNENDADASLYFPEWDDVPYLVVSPLARGTMGYQGVAETDVWDMIADVKRRFKVDENRTYLTGLSMGGGGTLWIGLTRPDFWAAIAPVCPAPPQGTTNYLANAAALPTHFFQGDADPVVSTKSVDKWVEDFKSAGAKVEYTVFPGVGHNSWEKAYEDEAIFKWFGRFKRNPHPKNVSFATSNLKYNKSYWLEIMAIMPEKTARVSAEIRAANAINITAENVEALKIMPSPHVKYGKPLKLTVNGKPVNMPNFSQADVLVFKDGSFSVQSEINFLKTSELYGPMTAVTASRHVYVYGTLDQPDAGERANRRKLAEEAADWSFYRGEFLGRVMVFPRVLADSEVTKADLEGGNLVLFGTEKSNALIAKFGDNLPFKSIIDSNQSLVYVYPEGKRLVLVNSGLPFWKIPFQKNSNLLSILRSPAKTDVLAGYGDWLFYDGKEVHSGYFDNQWEIQATDLSRLNLLKILK